ncbi:MAG: alpha-L-fucosidase [Armatimonadota bacterium]
MKVKASILALTAIFSISAQAQQTNSVDPRANETKEQRDARMKWWREARFGMFIHWGVYSVPAGTYDGKQIGGIGEWIMRSANIPVARYEQYAKQFNPEKFNATEWVSYAKAAGMKYIVMTAKHHDGFAMYPTKVSDWNITARSEFKRDPIGEMSAACRKAGIKFGVYYSQNLDWHHAGGGTAGSAWDDAQKGDFHKYVREISAPQVNELLTNYKPAVLWWDINGPFDAEEIKALTASFPKVPGLISNNRLGGGVPGDTETPEQFIPATGFKGRDWETCMTMNDTWGFKSYDNNFKSTTTLVRNLIDIASKGGNYLLNVGPTSEGIIPAPEVDRLKEVGQWMKANGSSIYATSASPYRKLAFDGRATVKGSTLFLNVFTWPSIGISIQGLQNSVKSAVVIATGEKLSVEKKADGSYVIDRPSRLDAISTAISLTLDGPPTVVEPEMLLGPSKTGIFNLNAEGATLDGDEIKLQESGENANIGFWTNPNDAITWKVNRPGTDTTEYQAKLEFACPEGVEGSKFRILVDDKPSGVKGTVTKTKSWNDFETMSLDGLIRLTPGKHLIKIKVDQMPKYAVMNVKRLALTPVVK